MKFFVKYVITGFALSLGSALFKKIQRHIGLEDKDTSQPEAVRQDGATDSKLQHRYS